MGTSKDIFAKANELRKQADDWPDDAKTDAIRAYEASEYQITAWEWAILFALLFAAAAVFVAVVLYVAGLAGAFD